MSGAKVTLEEIMAARTPRGSWTKAQLQAWGVPWPPQKGWAKRLTGDESTTLPIPGRTKTSIDLARKTRIQLEQENVALMREVIELRREMDRLRVKAGV
jgi:hypothetical protein